MNESHAGWPAKLQMAFRAGAVSTAIPQKHRGKGNNKKKIIVTRSAIQLPKHLGTQSKIKFLVLTVILGNANQILNGVGEGL